jgi:hypothetical protein
MAGDEAYGGGGMETDYRVGDNDRVVGMSQGKRWKS